MLGVRPHRLSVRTAPFHGAERGSIPLGAIGGLTDTQLGFTDVGRKGFSTLTSVVGAVAQFG